MDNWNKAAATAEARDDGTVWTEFQTFWSAELTKLKQMDLETTKYHPVVYHPGSSFFNQNEKWVVYHPKPKPTLTNIYDHILIHRLLIMQFSNSTTVHA